MPSSKMNTSPHQLAINGGEPVRRDPLPPKRLIDENEKRAAMRLFDTAVDTGNAYGYSGIEEKALCDEFAQFIGGGFADGVNSGTNAVFAALGALQLEPGSEVVIPPNTDPGGAMPVALLNCIPVQADSAPASFNMGPEQLEEALTERTRAVIVAHIAGLPADMNGIMRVAEKNNIFVLEDCAQALGARLNGSHLGTFGHLAAFSTMFGKHICTGGQGGLVYTRHEEYYWRVRRFSDRGKPFNIETKGNILPALNMNMDELSAAVGREQLKKLPDIVAKRRAVVQRINEGICDVTGVSFMEEIPGAEASYWFAILGLDEAELNVSIDTFIAALNAEGISASTYRHIPAEQPWFNNSENTATPYWYRGKVNTQPEVPNIDTATKTYFRLDIHQNFDRQTTDDIVRALGKVASAYRKEPGLS